MLRALLSILIIIATLSACTTQRMVCPAFQSAYIYDKDALRKKFSYFQEDSTPKILTASKTKYLIAEPVSYRKKVRSLQTVSVKPIYVTLPDSLKVGEKEGMEGEDGVVPGAELDLAARSVIDSIYIVDVPKQEETKAEDSVYVISKDREIRFLKYRNPDSLVYDAVSGRYVPKTPKYEIVEIRFNVEQDNYMWYLRDYLVLPDVRLARMRQSDGDGSEGKEAKKEKKGIKGFFKNLFKKKQKEEPVEEEVKPNKNENEDFDFIDEDAQEAQEQDKALEEKKERKPKKEKREKKPKQTEPAKNEDVFEDNTPPLKIEDSDDGF